MRMRVLRRFGVWHWWCPSCVGGDWCADVAAAHDEARHHVARCH